MTAGEVAKATGLGRASISTTLSRLAKSVEVTKTARGYHLARAERDQAAQVDIGPLRHGRATPTNRRFGLFLDRIRIATAYGDPGGVVAITKRDGPGARGS